MSKISKNEETLWSPELIVHKIPWKIKVVSRKSKNDGKQLCMGVYLFCEPKFFTVDASVEIRLLHTTDPKKNLVKNKYQFSQLL